MYMQYTNVDIQTTLHSTTIRSLLTYLTITIKMLMKMIYISKCGDGTHNTETIRYYSRYLKLSN